MRSKCEGKKEAARADLMTKAKEARKGGINLKYFLPFWKRGERDIVNHTVRRSYAKSGGTRKEKGGRGQGED